MKVTKMVCLGDSIVPLESYQDGILKMNGEASLHGITPILGLPIPSSDKWLEGRLEKYRSWLKVFSSANCVGLVDFSPVMLSPEKTVNRECYTDEVHPSKTGYRSMASLFVEFCRGYLK
ncbi:MAG: SGNH/GDSL hydrolase family protein [Eubacteriales bacterium]